MITGHARGATTCRAAGEGARRLGATAAGLPVLVVVALGACSDVTPTQPELDAEMAPASTVLAATSHDGAVDWPMCDGVPATIWVGMDPALLPKHAVLEQLDEDPDHGDDHGDHHEPGHETGGGSGGGPGHEPGHDPAGEEPSDHEPGQCGDEHDDEDGEGHARWRIVGTNGPDVIVGVRGPSFIDGRNGDDLICALAGPDRIWGGNGDDRIFGGPGPDLIWGELGNDWIDGGRSPDEIWGANGNDVLIGDRGSDLLVGGHGDDELYGGIGIDILIDDKGENILDPGPQECGGGPGEEEHDHSGVRPSAPGPL
jgi:hypothetical protein